MPKKKKPNFIVSWKLLFRVWFVILLIVIDYFLLKQLVTSNQIQFSNTFSNLLEKIGFNIPNEYQSQITSMPKFTLSDTQLLQLENQKRIDSKSPELERDPDLDLVARLLAQAFQADEYQVDKHNYQEVLNNILKEVKYPYLQASEVALIGPTDTNYVFNVWQEDEPTNKLILSPEFIKTGIYIDQTQIDGYLSGVVVQIFVQPPKKAAQKSVIQSHQQSAKNIPDQEVIAALNQYRADHSVHPLQVNEKLCNYASTRVSDLIAYGGLDHHQGFIDDFADPKNYPKELEGYTGRGFGENLASQFCINGTTKESFIAETGTSLIEWCFDSSTSGHREAQLNPKYNSVCSRHGNNMYVIIFGE